VEPLHALAGDGASAVGCDGVVVFDIEQDELAVVGRGFVQRYAVPRGDMVVVPCLVSESNDGLTASMLASGTGGSTASRISSSNRDWPRSITTC